MAKFEFIVIGIGLSTSIASKGALCPDGGCPKGVPNLKFEDDSVFAHDGYKKIKGPAKPLVLGGRRFGTEAQADKWLLGKDGIRFKEIFMNVFIARVTA